ncbi:MAG: glycosyltransferase family 39 protein [Bacteroidota bacterium]|nr:glycosyltransferase family 39 protein [Bacteroidota bacterium]MDP3144930.1 glycosyltransferase family 39 protein [Bacteroidota bacterium]MDP3557057.1 glycosyltransferase family 39 protein [Bacteroidota bacterium]
MNLLSKKWFLPIIFVLINILTKSWYLTTQSICIDEPFTIYHAQFDFVNLIHYLKNYNNPPLFEIILHFWIKIFGISPESVRTLPMLLSSFSVFFIYQIGIKNFDKRTAIITSILFSLSTYNIWYAHDCRVYSLFVLLTVISFYLFFEFLKEKEKFKWSSLILFAIVNLLLVYGHYFGFFVWLVEFLVVVSFFLKSPLILKKYSVVSILSLLFYIPQIVVLFNRTKASITNGTWVEAPDGFESIYNMLWYFCNEPIPTVICILLLIGALVKYILSKNKKSGNRYAIFIAMWFIIPFLLMFFISYKIPMFIERYLLFTSPAFYFLLALSVLYLFKQPKFQAGAIIVLTGVFFFSATLNPSKKREVRDVVDYIKAKKNEKTIVFVCGYDFILNFAYYYNIDYFKLKNQKTEYSELENAFKSENIYFINEINDSLINKINSFDKVIYFDAEADFSSPNNKIKETLFEKLKFSERTFFYRKFNVYNFKVNKK